jgi:hypothetical protein
MKLFKKDPELLVSRAEEKRQKWQKFVDHQIKFTVLSIVAVLIIALSSSYAIFSSVQNGTKYNVIKSGTLSVAYNDTDTGLGNVISLNGAYPTSDTDGQATSPYVFKITNNGTLNANYTISIVDDTDMITTDGCSAKQLDKNFVKFSVNGGTPVILGSLSSSSYVIKTGILNAGASKTYSVRVWLSDTADATALGKHFHGKIEVNSVNTTQVGGMTVEEFVAKANPASLTEYTSATTAQKAQMFTFSHTAGTQQSGWTTAELTDYRYIGSSPNNYVTFNGETWRIIGVFTVENSDGTKSQKIKIIRDSIGNYSWDSSVSTINSGWGINEWSQADLMTELNSGAYWSRTSGTCYNGQNNATTTCDFSSTGLTSTAKAMISPTKYYLGSTTAYTTELANQFYTDERGTTIVSATDGVTRTTNWVGNVGLMYPSDYGYATGGGSTTNEQACLEKELYNWNSSSYSDCKTNDWLYNSSLYQWFLSPVAGYQYDAFYVNTAGYVNYHYGNGVNNAYAARPVIYLKSDILVTGGDGSLSNPYVLG